VFGSIDHDTSCALASNQSLGIHEEKLRLFAPNGRLMPLPEEDAEERAEQAEERAEQAEERAEQAEERAVNLAAKLRELGIDPDRL
jgi:hypothetical protein